MIRIAALRGKASMIRAAPPACRHAALLHHAATVHRCAEHCTGSVPETRHPNILMHCDTKFHNQRAS
ncbi:MAG: hypothetical protein WCY72_07260, partial [Lysobacteraceae bacterium]